MYHALYRKWRPQKFADVVGQEPIVTALQNQIASGRIGHAYLFTGTRGTGKTTCAKIFAKAINCLDHSSPDPCGECEVCRGIDDGTVLDVSEIDAASNNSVDDIRDLRDETAFLPTVCQYKVYIIDEVHMLSTSAFNALLKTMEEPPPHVIFILATTEVQKVPATILSRCQRYDFARITADKIAGRLLYVASQESFTLTEGAAALIGRLADGAMRDALSILDTCAGVSNEIDEALVRRMAGVTDRAYLFEISDAVAAGDAVTALQKVAELRQQSVDMRRLCTELAGHYRNLMLSSLPQGTGLLTGISPEEEAAYAARAGTPQADAIRGIEVFGRALEKMGRGADQRIELELAIFSLTQPAAKPVVQVVQQVPPATSGASAPFAMQPAPPPAQADTSVSAVSPAAPQPPVAETSTEVAPWQAAPANPQAYVPEPSPPQPPVEPPAPARTVGSHPQPFAPWTQVLEALSGADPAMFSFLQGSKAYYDGKRVLIDCNEPFRDYMRKDKSTYTRLKKVILDVSGVRCGIGPYEKPKAAKDAQGVSMEDTLKAMQNLGVDVVVEDK